MRCYKCGIEKPAEFFHKNKSKPFGLDNRCKQCKKDYGHSDERKAITDKFYQDNREELVRKSVEYNVAKYKTNHIHRFQIDLGCSIRRAIKLKMYKPSSRIAKVLGCTSCQFISHIESQFTEGMNWENHGEWQVDHIIPNSYAKTVRDVIILNHYSNLQPLWVRDNYMKANLLPENFAVKFFEMTLNISDLDILVENFVKKYF